jgi:hypothetical protein
MGKKNKEKKSRAPEKKKGSPVIWIVAVVVVVIGGLAVSGNLPFQGEKDTGPSFNLKGKETRPVLDPAMFAGRIRTAYAIAKKYPDVLNEVFCYCYCDQPPFHHNTLLSCFTDKHGAG